MAPSPRICLGLPVYNGERYLRQAIDSMLAQTFRDFELIISDNASTDRTREICLEYQKRDPRVRYFRNESNIGPAANFNLVFQRAHAEYFKWVAADDVCEPDFLRTAPRRWTRIRKRRWPSRGPGSLTTRAT